MITFQHVTFTYPGANKPVLSDLNLNIPLSSFTLVIGASGAGKSTLLRCINGLVPHFSGGSLRGTIRVNDLDPIIATPQVMSRHVGFVFQDPEAQFVVNQVEDEIAFALEQAALPRQEMRIRVEETLDLLNLAALRERRLETLSGGERQRVAIGAALALRPRILVLDEPTSQLDPQSAEDVLQALVRLNSDLGLTIVLAEHRMERVLPFVDHMIALGTDANNESTRVITGEPRDVLAGSMLTPPLVTVGKALGWSPLPLTIKEGLQRSRMLDVSHHSAIPTAIAPRSGTPHVRVRDLDVAYEGRAALRGVSLDLWPNEIVALLGRNGAGKTTLLRAIVGLVQTRRGAIEVGGRTTRGRSVADICREVGYLPQDPSALLFAETVLDELLVTLANHVITGDRARQQAETMIAQLDLAAHVGAYPRDLSVGERQRVALGAITVVAPTTLLLDEPTRGLDYNAKADLTAILKDWRKEGKAIAIVTHDVEWAATIADRIIILAEGEVIADGQPREVLGASPLFAPQIARLFPDTGWLSAEDALHGLGRRTKDQG